MNDAMLRCDGTTVTASEAVAALQKMRDLSADNDHTGALRVLCADLLAQPELTAHLDEIAARRLADGKLSAEDEHLREEVRKMAHLMAFGMWGFEVSDAIAEIV